MTNDEDLQMKVEAGQAFNTDQADVRAYQQVFESLKKEPDFVLPSAFADNVLKRITKGKSSLTGEYIWLSLGVVIMLLGLILAFVYAGLKIDLSLLKGASGMKGIFAFGIIFTVFLHWLDRRFLKHTHTAG